uniref:C2H2-type domain-containing protein n=1 Tax=Cyclopterus lumpus TaxID=8103 RepID=A0A8C2WMB1_CYCLU
MSHRGVRPFSCPHCEKTYGMKRDLKEHLVLHTGEKPYVCEHCSKAFARRQSLLRHQAQHRAEGGRKEEEEAEQGHREEAQEASGHTKPIRGRPKKSSLPQGFGEKEEVLIAAVLQ